MQEDLDLKGPLLFRLGQILEERVLDLHTASETYWELARLDPTNRPALRQLRGIHERRGQWDMVLQIAELESQTTMPPYERAVFEAELGRTWKEQLGDPEEARAAFSSLPVGAQDLIRSTLAWDPRPAFHEDQRLYHLAVAGVQVDWSVTGGTCRILGIRP